MPDGPFRARNRLKAVPIFQHHAPRYRPLRNKSSNIDQEAADYALISSKERRYAMLKRHSTVIFSAIGILCNLTAPTLAEPVRPHTSIESVATPVFTPGDLVHLRSGGPLMTVDKVEGEQVTSHWTDEFGGIHSGSFSVADLSAPITLPATDPHLRDDESLYDRYYQEHCPSGVLTLSGKFKCVF
jgi:uncharacterized protein YodC (DUF2158 family)